MACFNWKRPQRRPAWVLIHIHRVRGLPLSCSDALFCQCIRRHNKRYSSQVTLAKNGVAVFNSRISLQCTLLSNSDGELEPKWARIEMRPVDCCIKGNYHDHYSLDIDLTEFLEHNSLLQVRTLTLAKGQFSVSLDVSICLADQDTVRESFKPIVSEEGKLSSFAAAVTSSGQHLSSSFISVKPSSCKENLKKPLLQESPIA